MVEKRFTLSLGALAPDFCLAGTDGKVYRRDDFVSGRGFVIFFTCNHCPYVVSSDENTRQLADHFQSLGIPFIAINSNSPNTYSEDSYPLMIERMAKHKLPWIYLYDATQKVAEAYGALRTPHFYLFNQKSQLVYTGRSMDSPRDMSKATTHELKDALEEFIAGKPITMPETNPIGCNVKWEGKDKHWMPADACDLILPKQ